MTSKIPVWIMIWGGLMALLALGFGLLGYLNPAGMYGEEVAAQGLAIYGKPIGFYISRNMATGLTTLFALSQRSVSMLIFAFVLRIITDIFDVLHQTLAGTLDGEFIFFATLLISGSSVAVFKLWGMRTRT